MPQTYDDAQKEERERIEEGGVGKGEDIGPGGETPVTFRGERLEEAADEFEEWVTATPDEIRQRLVEQRERIQRGGQTIEVDVTSQAGFNANQLLNNIQQTTTGLQDLQNILEFTALPSSIVVNDLGIEDLLQLQLRVLVNFISPNLASSAQLLKVISTANAQQVAALQNILDEVSPASQFVVTGRNIIDQTDNPEAVIPDADNTSVPTRTLFIRADSTNDDIIAFGDDKVDPDTGWFLRAGETLTVNQNFANEVLWMAGTSGDAVRLLGYL